MSTSRVKRLRGMATGILFVLMELGLCAFFVFLGCGAPSPFRWMFFCLAVVALFAAFIIGEGVYSEDHGR